MSARTFRHVPNRQLKQQSLHSARLFTSLTVRRSGRRSARRPTGSFAVQQDGADAKPCPTCGTTRLNRRDDELRLRDVCRRAREPRLISDRRSCWFIDAHANCQVGERVNPRIHVEGRHSGHVEAFRQRHPGRGGWRRGMDRLAQVQGLSAVDVIASDDRGRTVRDQIAVDLGDVRCGLRAVPLQHDREPLAGNRHGVCRVENPGRALDTPARRRHELAFDPAVRSQAI